MSVPTEPWGRHSCLPFLQTNTEQVLVKYSSRDSMTFFHILERSRMHNPGR